MVDCRTEQKNGRSITGRTNYFTKVYSEISLSKVAALFSLFKPLNLGVPGSDTQVNTETLILDGLSNTV